MKSALEARTSANEGQHQARGTISLNHAITHLLEECRMVLPGIQALFGFQLIAVFNERFSKELSRPEQWLHFGAVCLTCLAVGLVMAPAAYHRQMNIREASEGFMLVATRLLLAAMFPLMLAVCLDFFLIARLIFQNAKTSLACSVGLFAVFLTLWFVLPRFRLLRSLLGDPRRTL